MNSSTMFCALFGSVMLVIAAAVFSARDFLAVEIVSQIRDTPGIPFRRAFLAEKRRDGRAMLPVAIVSALMSALFFVLGVLSAAGVLPHRSEGSRFGLLVLTGLFVVGTLFLLLAYLSARLRTRLTERPRFVTLSRDPVPVTSPSGARLFRNVAAVAGVVCLVVGVGGLLH